MQQKTFTYPAGWLDLHRIGKFPRRASGTLSKIDLTGIRRRARSITIDTKKTGAAGFAPVESADNGRNISGKHRCGQGRRACNCVFSNGYAISARLDYPTGGIDLAFRITETKSRRARGGNRKQFREPMDACRAFACRRREAGQCRRGSLQRVITLPKDYKPSGSRFALASVPYSKQTQCHVDGLQQAASSVDGCWNLPIFCEPREVSRRKAIRGLAARIAKGGLESCERVSDDLNYGAGRWKRVSIGSLGEY